MLHKIREVLAFQKITKSEMLNVRSITHRTISSILHQRTIFIYAIMKADECKSKIKGTCNTFTVLDLHSFAFIISKTRIDFFLSIHDTFDMIKYRPLILASF